MFRRMLAIAMLLCLCVAPRLARAEGDGVVVVIEAGHADLMIESLVRLAAEDALRTAERKAAPLEAAGGATRQAMAACATESADCVARAAEGATAEQILFVQLVAEEIDGADAELILTVRLFDVQTGKQLAFDKRVCTQCSDPDRLSQTVEELTADLLVSGQVQQVTPPPDAGSVRLIERPRIERRVMTESRFGLWKHVVLAGGVGALAAGATLIVLDGPQISDGVRMPDERATRLEGFVGVGVGAALIVTSAFMWVGDDKEVVVGGTVGDGGAGLSLGGRF